jgi:hypothetical protein
MFGQSNLWSTFACPGTARRWRILPDLRIEIEGHGSPIQPWPKGVDQWSDLIALKAAEYSVPAYWIAAIMALETAGQPGLCLKTSDGSCSTREGMGLMAMLLSTANTLAGRTVTEEELLNDYDLQIDLGAKLIAQLSDKYQGDYVKVAIGYNAGSVRCGSGNTFQQPKEPCPPTPWGVVMGCIRTSRAINSYCAPSTVDPAKFACPVNYPQVAIGTHNAALAAGWNAQGLGTKPLPVPPPIEPGDSKTLVAGLGAGAAVPLIAGGVLGFLAVRKLRSPR